MFTFQKSDAYVFRKQKGMTAGVNNTDKKMLKVGIYHVCILSLIKIHMDT